MWGRAVYFAVNASYSCGSYAHSVPNGHPLSDGSVLANGAKVVLFAKVQVGKEHPCPSNSSLRGPPDGFESIKGNTGGSDVYMIYSGANKRTYPMFLVYFS